jgi:CDGSH-type Zn-finger protein
MARLIRHEATGPHKIDPKTWPEGKFIFVCGCGLSKTLPFCDGTHKTCTQVALA